MADGIYTLEEVAKHNTKSDLWIVVWNHVYNVTDYQEDHPGGKDFLLESAGADATTAYEDVGHSTDAREILENFRIGRVSDEDWTDHGSQKIPEVKPRRVHVVNNSPPPTWHQYHIPTLGIGLVSIVGAIVLGRSVFPFLHRFQGGGFWKGFAVSSAASMLLAGYASLWATKSFNIAHKDFQSYPAHIKAKAPSKKPPVKKDINLGVLNAREYQPFELKKKFNLSHDTIRLVFALPHENSVLGLPTGQHIAIRHEVDGKQIARSYTPTSSNKDKGRLELTIKIYEGGKLTPWLNKLSIGDSVDIRGPKGEMKYHKNLVKELGMIAGGTGITPMFQMIRRICEDPRDDTKVTLLYANKTEQDILLTDELDTFAAEHQQFKVRYVLGSPPNTWKGESGRIDKKMIEQYLPAPAGMDTKVLVCGPDPMMQAMIGYLQERGFKEPGKISKPQDEIFTFHGNNRKLKEGLLLFWAEVSLGRRIACSWVAAGYEVILCDLDEKQRNAAAHYVEHHVEEFAKITGIDRKPGNFSSVAEMEVSVKDAWLLIEALPEKLELKISMMGKLDQHAPADCILASNSSSYKSRLMLDKVDPSRRHRVCNAHYYMPPGNNTVELMTCGETDESLLEFLKSKFEDAGMVTAIARKESTGFIFNRLWAAIKRESLQILAEGVSDPAEIDKLFLTMFQNTPAGPCGLMDAVGLDTVAFIEDNYIQERNLQSEGRDWLQKNYIDQGKLGAKSGKGGLYPAGATTQSEKREGGHHDNLAAPRLYFLDLGLGDDVDLQSATTSGKIITASADGSNVRELVAGQSMPDGISISIPRGRIFWTNMGKSPSKNDGSVWSAKLDGSDIRPIVPEGQVHTPKQIQIDEKNEKLYFCDREGMRVHRCDFDGSNHEIIYQSGDGKTSTLDDQKKWCVGIAVDPEAGKFYWSQKGPSKAGQGRIFRANISLPEGETASSRSDVELLFDHLPEPIDLDIDSDTKTLYWTDRGEYPVGNTLSSAPVGTSKKEGMSVTILARHFHEAIGLAVDKVNQHIYIADLGGAVYRVDIDGKNKKKIYSTESTYSGIALAHLH